MFLRYVVALLKMKYHDKSNQQNKSTKQIKKFRNFATEEIKNLKDK